MTTTVSLAARDFIVVGSDSLATTSMNFISAAELDSAFFEPSGDLKVDAAGKPLIADVGLVMDLIQSVPVNQLPSVTKLFELEHINGALLFAGIARIGGVSVKNLVAQFKELPAF